MARSFRVSARTAVLVASIGASGAALAADPPTDAQAAAIREACRADYASVCAAVPPGGAPALACLRQNILKVSQPCQVALAAAESGGAPKPAPATAAAPPSAPAAGSAPASAPAASAAAPPGRPPQGGAASSLTPREELAIVREACGPDYRQFCSGVRPGGGRAIECLAANDASLAPACRKVVAAARQRM